MMHIVLLDFDILTALAHEMQFVYQIYLQMVNFSTTGIGLKRHTTERVAIS